MTHYRYYVETFTLPQGDFAHDTLPEGHRIHSVLQSSGTNDGVQVMVLVEVPEHEQVTEYRG